MGEATARVTAPREAGCGGRERDERGRLVSENSITRDELAEAWKRLHFDESCLPTVLADIEAHREPENAREAPPSLAAKRPPPVPDEAVDASLEAVARYWKGSRSVLQAYPSRPLTRVMLEAAAPHITAPRLTDGECDRLREMVTEHEEAVKAVERALEFAAAFARTGQHHVIIAKAREALRVLEGAEEETRDGR